MISWMNLEACVLGVKWQNMVLSTKYGYEIKSLVILAIIPFLKKYDVKSQQSGQTMECRL